MNNTLFERFNAASSREKLMLLATAIVIIWSAWDNLLLQPMLTERKQLNTELLNLNTELTIENLTAVEIEASGKVDPNAANKKKLLKVNTEITLLKQQLNTNNKQFVSADTMAIALQDMLKQNPKLSLINLETIKNTDLTETIWLFRHGLSITVSGDYFSTLSYLQSLEALNWRFNWGTITYNVTEYPIAETTFQIYILSFEESWLGL